MKNRFYLVLVLAALTCLAGWTARAQYSTRTVPRQAWEYQQVQFDLSINTFILNQHGQEGWELLAVTSSCPSNPQTTSGCKYTAYLKREK
jgi:hypothetical protein